MCTYAAILTEVKILNFLCHLYDPSNVLIGVIGPTFRSYYCIVVSIFYNLEILYFDANKLFLFAFPML